MEMDIRTRIIPDDHTVVVARPGAKYALFTEFQDQSFVGVELPGLFARNEAVSYDDDNIVARIKRALAVRKWINSGRTGDEPSRDLAEYDNASNSSSIRQYLRLLRFYLRDVPTGALILNPPPTFNGLVRIGEVPEDHAPRFYNVTRYEGELIVGIPVIHLGALRKKELPSNALEALKKPTALFAIGPDRRDKIYAAAFGNFVFRGRYTSTFKTRSERYDSWNELVFQAFINSVALNTRNVDEKRGVAVDLGEAASSLLGGKAVPLGDYALDLNLNINSPGLISIISGKVTPIVAAALFVLAVTIGPAAHTAVMDNALVIGNSLGGSDMTCAAQVQEQVYTQLKLLGWDKWVSECERLAELRGQTGFETLPGAE